MESVSEVFSLAVRLAVRRGVRATSGHTGQNHVAVGPWTLVFYGRDAQATADAPHVVPPQYCVVVMRAGVPVGVVYPSGGTMLSRHADTAEEDALVSALESALSDNPAQEAG